MLRPFLRYHLPALAWATAIALAMLWQPPTVTGVTAGPVWLIFSLSSTWWDIGTHVVVFALMGGLAWRSIARLGSRGSLSVERPVLIAAALTLAYGGLLEVGQELTPGRALEIRDVVANGLGGWLGAWLASSVLRSRHLD